MEKRIIQKQYDDISMIYDLLSDGDDGGLYFHMHAEKLLSMLPKNASVLDCSCGTGNHAIWLARQGFNTFASDISEGMINVARDKAEKEKINIGFLRCSWEELPEKTNERFDMIFCPGNSLSHLRSLEMLNPTFESIRKVLKPGGTFVFDIRNWEKTFEEVSLETQEFQVKNKKDIFDVRYSYDIRGWNTSCFMYVDVRLAGEKEYTRHVFDFYPIGYQQFHDALLLAGFESVQREFYPGEDYYFAIAN